jgi:two-component system sensor histidine kinase HydH
MTALLDRLLHDLKQPLNFARVAAQEVRLDLRAGRLDLEALPASMTEIERAVDETTRRVDCIRAFATPHRATSSVLADVARACRAATARLVREQPELVIDVQVAGGLPPAVMDEAALEQALWELLANGVAAARDSGLEPRLAVDAALRDGAIVIGVEDNGAGVPAAERERIFEPFVNLRIGGAGLGLALARALCAAAGGAIVCTEASPGARFELRVGFAPEV